MKRLRVILWVVFAIGGLSFEAHSQAGNTCANAIPITPETGACTSPGYSNVGYTSVGDPIPSCWGSAPDNSVWFTFVADSPQVTINSNFTTFPGSITDTEVALFSGACGSLTEVDCNETIGPGNDMAAMTIYNLTPGNTYYIMFDGNNQTGNFNICIEDLASPFPPAPGQDCITALPLCNTDPITFDPLAPGFGGTDESGNCMTFGETQSTWVSFTAANNGTLEFAAGPLCNNCEYDFVMYDISGGCNLNNGDIVQCNYNFDGASGSATGLGTVPGGSSAAEFNAAFTLTAGTTYGLMIDNYTANNVGFDLSFGGSALFEGPPSPTFTLTPTSGCADLVVNFTNTSPAELGNFSWDFGDGSPATSVNNPTHTYTAGGTYTVTLTATDTVSGACSVTQTATVTVDINPTADFTMTPPCSGTNVTFNNTSTGATSYEWDFTSGGSIDATSTNPAFTFPNNVGPFYTTLIATNAGGCTDTLFQLVIFGPIADAGNDTTIACDSITMFDGSYSNVVLPTSQFTYNSTVNSAIPDGMNSVTVTQSIADVGCTLSNVCLNITHTDDADIDIFLSCPSGTQVELSTDNGSGGNNYTNTCFSMSGAISITAGTAPFTGTFIPEGDFASFTGCTSNGNWSLQVSDDAMFDTGTLLDWSLTFDCPSPPTVSWSPTTNLSDPNILNPTFSNSAPGTYTYVLSVTDANCTVTDTVVVTVQCSCPTLAIAGTNVSCNGAADGTATVTPSGGSLPFTYTWNTVPVQTNATATGLPGGTALVTAVDNAGCSDTISIFIVEPTAILLTPAFTNETCDGDCDGTASITASGGNPPYTYSWSNGPTTSSITGLCDAGYGVTVTDNSSCQQTSSVTIAQGLVLAAGFSYNGNQCLNGNSFVFLNTGTSGITYSWDFGDAMGSSTLEDPSYTYVSAGTFTVIQTVSSGTCSASSSTNITVYPQPSVTVSGNNVTCNSACDGSTTSSVSGGTSPYTYSWSPSGGTGSGATSLCPNTYTLTVTDNLNCSATDNVIITEPAALAVVMSGNPANCNGAFDGDAIATPSGGTGSYTYQWDDPAFQTNSTANNLDAGTYNVTVTDSNSCSVNGLFVVTEPSAITLTPSSTDATCGSSDGTASVGVTGGAGPYTYSWNTVPVQTNSTAAGIPSGAYSVTVTDAGGCTNDTTATVNDAGSPTATIGPGTNVTCNGGNNGDATVTATGGTGAYTYTWSTVPAQTNATATGLAAISYSVTVSDNLGCSGTDNISITQPAAVVVSVTGSSNLSCNGVCDGTATASSSGGTGAYTYSWNTVPVQVTAAASGLCATSYTVTVLDANNCTNNTSVTLTEPTALNPSITGIDPTCNGGTNGSVNLTVTGGTGAYTYLWSPGGETTEDISGLTFGSYSVTIADANSCDTNISITLTEPTLIVPTASAVDANCGQADGQVTVSAVGGTGAYTYLWDDSGNSTTAGVNNLPTGVYNVTVSDANGCSAVTSTIINNLSGGSATASIVTNVSISGGCDGEASVAMAGGIAPFTYIWNDPGTQTTINATGLCAGTYCVTVTDSNGCASSDCIIISEPPPIVLSITGINNLCNAGCTGQATVTAVGGVTPYTYSWSPSGGIGPVASNLCANTYTVTLIDANGATDSISIVITEPTALSIALTPSNPLCNAGCDGEIQAVVTGGTGVHTYLWDDPGTQTTALANGLCAGSFMLSVTDANSCSLTDTEVLTNPPAITITTSFINATCGVANGQACVTSSTGAPPLSYQWDDPGLQTNACATGLDAGSFNVLVTDSNRCNVTDVIGISNADGPTAVISTFTDVTCTGFMDGSATVVTTDGTPPYTYLWSDGNAQTSTTATGLGAGNYTVQITDVDSCITTVSVLISVPSALVSSIASQIDVSCNDSCDGSISASVSGGTGTLTYLWSNADITPSISGLCANTYLLTITDSNGCQDTISAVITEPLILGLTATVFDASCAGICDGSVTTLVTGGTIPYTYQWDDPSGQTTSSAFGLCGGNITILVTDAKGCTVSASNFVSTPVAITVSISSSGDIDCNGNCNGYAQTLVAGGTPAYTYNWNDNQTGAQAIGLCAGSFQVTVSDSQGCSDSTSVVITQPPLFSTTIAKNDATCNALCNGEASITPVGGAPPYLYQWNDSQLQTTITATALCAGIVNVTITDNNGCNQTEFINIAEPQLLTFIPSSISSTCGNPNGSACVSVIGGVFPYTVTWNDPGNTAGLCVNNVVGGTYIPVLVDGNGCFYSQPVIINDVVGPGIDTKSVTDVTCYGYANGLISVTIDTLGTAPYTYIWKDNDGDTVGFNSSIIFGLSGGSYSVTIKDGNGCVFSENFIINEPSQFVANVMTSNNTTCFGYCDGDATALAGGGTTPLTYSWLPSGDTGTFASALCAGTHNIIVTDSNGCTASNSTVITEPALLTINTLVTNVSCFGGNDGIIDLLPSPYGGTPPYLFSWSQNVGSGATVTNLSAGIDTVTVTDINSCTIIQAILLSEPPELLLSVSTTESTCGDPNGEISTSASGGTGSYTYSWDSPGTPTTSSVSGLLVGTYNVTVSDANGCSVIDAGAITNITGVTLASISKTDENCFGSADGTASVATFKGVAPFTFVWSSGTPSDSNCTNLSSGMVYVTVTDSNGCTDNDSILISSPLALALSVSAPDTICYGGTALIVANVSDGTFPYAYTWDNGLPTSSSHTVVLTLPNQTIYNVTVTDDHGCVTTDNFAINVRAPLQVALPVINSCIGNNVSVLATGMGGNGTYTFTWNNNTYIGNPLVLSNIQSDTILSVTLSDNCSQDDVAQVNITVFQSPAAAMSWACAPDPYQIQFMDLSTGNNGVITAWDWDFGDANSSGDQNPAHDYASTDNYIVQLVVTTADNCTDTATIQVQSPPTADFAMELSGMALTDPVELSILSSTVDLIDGSSNTVADWFWNFYYPSTNMGGDSTAVVQNVSHQYDSAGYYNILLMVTDDNGCIDTTVKRIRIKDEYIVFVPNSFTPNEDGINDFFYPHILGVENEEFKMYIFDRWGDRIFKYDDLYSSFAGWNGRANSGGSMAQNDVYVWLVVTEDENGEVHRYIGHVTLIR